MTYEVFINRVRILMGIIGVSESMMLFIAGIGINLTDFSDRVSALFTLAYGIKMLFKKTNIDKNNSSYNDFTVFPLEGIWKKNSVEQLDKNKLKYVIMIKHPDFITRDF